MFLMLGLVVRAGAEAIPNTKPDPFGLSIGQTELFLAFVAACLFPNWFSVLAYAVGILCFVSAGSRLAASSREP